MDFKEITNMKDEIKASYNGLSWEPGKRAANDIKEYARILSSDLADLPSESQSEYKKKYFAKIAEITAANSRCMSSVITGPSNFPFDKNKKNMDAYFNKIEKFNSWRERYVKAVNRQPKLSPESDLDIQIQEYDKLVYNHHLMKEVNKIIRKKTTDDEKRVKIKDLGFSDDTVKSIMGPTHACQIKGFALSNNNAKIKRVAGRIRDLKKRIDLKDNGFEKITFEGGYIDIKDNRVVIKHDERPDREVISAIKERGFKWSRQYGCWSRVFTLNALSVAKQIISRFHDLSE